MTGIQRGSEFSRRIFRRSSGAIPYHQRKRMWPQDMGNHSKVDFSVNTIYYGKILGTKCRKNMYFCQVFLLLPCDWHHFWRLWRENVSTHVASRYVFSLKCRRKTSNYIYYGGILRVKCIKTSSFPGVPARFAAFAAYFAPQQCPGGRVFPYNSAKLNSNSIQQRQGVASNNWR